MPKVVWLQLSSRESVLEAGRAYICEHTQEENCKEVYFGSRQRRV